MDWQTLITRPDTRKIYLVELDLVSADGATPHRLVLSDTAIEAAYKAEPVDNSLLDVPYLYSQLQDALVGRTRVTMGRLRIDNAGQDFNYTRDLQWLGRGVVIKLGFDGLSTDDFQTIFTGRCGAPSFGASASEGAYEIVVPVYDLQQDMWTKDATAKIYTGTLPAQITDLLGQVGGVSTHAATWAAWAAEHNFTVWHKSVDGAAISTVLDSLLAPLGCYYSFNRAGEFIIQRLAPPSGAAALEITDYDLVADPALSHWDKRYWSMRMEYVASVSGDVPTMASTSRSTASILTICPSAEAGSRISALYSAANAATVRDRLWDIYSVQRRRLEITVKAQASGLALGDVVAVDLAHTGIAGDFRLVGMREDFSASETVLELFA